MPEKATMDKAKEDLHDGKSPSTAAGEFVHEEMDHVREGKHGARSTKQAIAIGLSKARRAGVPLKPPRAGQTSSKTRKSAERAYEAGQGRRKPKATSAKRSRATLGALKREGSRAASRSALSAHAKQVGRRRKAAGAGSRKTASSPKTSSRRK